MRSKTYFISDLHLGASYIADPRAHELRVVGFLRSIAEDCRRLILLGDILDYWWEYRTVVPRGFIRFFGALAELADAGVEIVWFKGNHDIWIFDYLPKEIGLKIHDGIMVTEMDGKRGAQLMYAAIHPRWTIGFAHSWSSRSRKQGGYVAPQHAGDNLIEFARAYNSDSSHEKIDYFIFGHCHILLRERLDDGSEVVILGDWINKFTYAVWDGNRLTIHQYEEKKK